MSHHWTENSEVVKAMQAAVPDDLKDKASEIADRIAEMRELGPTGAHPHGQLDPKDAGEIRLNVLADTRSKVVRMNFGAPITAIGLTYDEAMALSDMLTREAYKLRGISS